MTATSTTVADNLQDITRQVKEANDIVAVIGSYLALQPAGKNFKGICPFHQDTRPSLHVDTQWQNYRCWACGAKGDVFTFVQEFERVPFQEAREILAQRAGISLTDKNENSHESATRLRMLDALQWVENTFQNCLLDLSVGENGRWYLADRHLSGPTVRNFGLGFAPLSGQWLVEQVQKSKIDPTLLVELGVFLTKRDGTGLYDRFRDRLMFPIRNMRGQTVGFGGRILPNTTLPEDRRGPKYLNSSESILFKKQDLLYGLDLARHAAEKTGYLAVVEGYTDVMMAHQHDFTHVVATMGTALNEHHVQQLRRYAPKVVLVFDSDAGGQTGIDRALDIFISQDLELAIATLPEGLDPCDLLVRPGGAEEFRTILARSTDALDFKLNTLLERSDRGIEATRKIVDTILNMMAMAPVNSSQQFLIKQELLITRLAQRLSLRQETVWTRFGELQSSQRARNSAKVTVHKEVTPQQPAGPAARLERQLLEILLAEPTLVAEAQAAIPEEEITHPGLRKLLKGLYQLQSNFLAPDIDGLRDILNQPNLIAKAIELQEVGRMMKERSHWLREIIRKFQERVTEQRLTALREQLQSASTDSEKDELLRQLQTRKSGVTVPDLPPG
ncbi:MAG: DNA primase [Zavarzinella sp.]